MAGPALAEFKFESKRMQGFLRRISKGTADVKGTRKRYVAAMSTFVHRDVLDHFEQEMGPDGKWDAWSAIYAQHMARVGKSGNKILQDTGRLRGSFKPTDNRTTAEGILWFNNAKTNSGFNYAGHHNETRPFMWLSKDGLEDMAKATLRFIMAGGK